MDHEVIVTFTFHAMADTPHEAIIRAMNYFIMPHDLYPISVDIKVQDR